MKKFGLLCAALAPAVVAPVSAHAQETTSQHPRRGHRRRLAGRQRRGRRHPRPVGHAIDLDDRRGRQLQRRRPARRRPLHRRGHRAGHAGPRRSPTSSSRPASPSASRSSSAARRASIVVTGVRGARQTSNGPITGLNREDIEGVASVNRDIRDLARRDPFVEYRSHQQPHHRGRRPERPPQPLLGRRRPVLGRFRPQQWRPADLARPGALSTRSSSSRCASRRSTFPKATSRAARSTSCCARAPTVSTARLSTPISDDSLTGSRPAAAPIALDFRSRAIWRPDRRPDHPRPAVLHVRL